jgi:ribosomal protein S18 acetylase RimI-like enzyme
MIAWSTPGVDMLEGRRDLAVVWDLRIAPAYRRSGIGSMLWRACEAWAREHGCTQIRVETQDINPDACAFYAAMGCSVVVIRPNAYPEAPGETQIIWERSL